MMLSVKFTITILLLFAVTTYAKTNETTQAPSAGLSRNEPHYANTKPRRQNRSNKLATTTRQTRCPTWDQCSFFETFAYPNWFKWDLGDNYANGVPFNCWWSKNNAFFNFGRRMFQLTLGVRGGHGTPYVSGHLKSKTWHGYGCYEVKMRPVSQKGVVTTFFSYTGPWDAAPRASGNHNEVDIEFVWKKEWGKTVMQANYFTDGRGGNEKYIPLWFNPSANFHNYAFKWTSRKIEWFVDGRKVYEATKNTPKAYRGHHKIMANLWPVSDRAAGWAGKYNWEGPKTAEYAGIRFTRGEHCRIANTF